MESEYKSIRRSIAQFRSIDLVLTCVDIGMLAFSLKETVGCVPAGLSEMHRSVGRVRATRSAAVTSNVLRPLIAHMVARIASGSLDSLDGAARNYMSSSRRS